VSFRLFDGFLVLGLLALVLGLDRARRLDRPHPLAGDGADLFLLIENGLLTFHTDLRNYYDSRTMLKSIGVPELLIIFVVLSTTLVTVFPFIRISQRLGWSPWWGVLTLLPFGTLIWSFYVAFTDWPAQRKQ
jgi:hypothetical protein